MTHDQHLHEPAVERAVLGAVLLDPVVLPKARGILTAADFYDPRHATLWEAFLSIADRGEAIDVLTVVAELRARERLHTIGGAQYVGELTDELPTAAHVAAHAGIVRAYAQRRQTHTTLRDALSRLLHGDPLGVIEQEVSRALQAQKAANDNAGLLGEDVDDFLDRVAARMEGRERPIPTPWLELDELLGGGLWPGMYVLVGGTGAGKTQWAMQVSMEAAQRQETVLYLALELSRQDILARAIGQLSGVPWSKLLRGQFDPSKFDAVADASRRVKTLPFHTECAPPFGYGSELLASRARTLRPRLVVLDYLQLVGGKVGEDARTTVGRVSYIARMIARDFGAVVLVLSSTARANYTTLVNDDSKDPSDLVGLGKESGEIEYAADGVLVLAKHKDEPRKRVLVLAKNRYGATGRVEFDWSGTHFSQPSPDAEFMP